MDATAAKSTFKRGNLVSVVVAPTENSERWILRLKFRDGGEVSLQGTRTRREFIRVQTALRVAKQIGFDKVEVDLE